MKVYDCFGFFNELDLLEIRLNILNPYVDYFVIVESTRTFNGNPKKLYYDENKERYAQFKDKIIHIKVENMPDPTGGNAWIPEVFQREQISRGLKNCVDGDIIMVSDMDEIPNPRVLTNAIEYLHKNTLTDKLSRKLNMGYKFSVMNQKLYYYYLNGLTGVIWKGTTLCDFKTLKEKFGGNPHTMYRANKKAKAFDNGGWHFSYLGGAESIRYKIKSYAHTELDNELYTNPEEIKARVENGEDLFDRTQKITYVKVDSTFPEFIVKNMDKYSKHIKKVD